MSASTAGPAIVRVLSGIQPSGVVHVGNYVGAIQRWAARQDEQDALYMIADLHTLTLPYRPAALPGRTRETLAALIACGLRPESVTLFVQSWVPEHTGLCWLLMGVARIGDLRRMTHFKDKAAAEREAANAALLAYPVLQAADVLLYQAEEVPVGDDQRQHLELVSDIARRFNNLYGPTFTVPRGVTPDDGARVMDLQEPTAKMSKSRPSPMGVILLSDSSDEIARKVRRAVTDSAERYHPHAEGPGIRNLLTIYTALGSETRAEVSHQFDGTTYGEIKEAAAERICRVITPMRDAYFALLGDERELMRIMTAGAERARAIASSSLSTAREAMGFAP
jgi:tryptophanyl-tRNA synthetase